MATLTAAWKLIKRWPVAIVIVVALGGVAYFTARWTVDQAEQARAAEARARRSDDEAAAVRRQLIDMNNRVLECQTPAGTEGTPEGRHECFEEIQERTRDLLARAALLVGFEADCRTRRAIARLPAPADPERPCAEQTPARVYPGG